MVVSSLVVVIVLWWEWDIPIIQIDITTAYIQPLSIIRVSSAMIIAKWYVSAFVFTENFHSPSVRKQYQMELYLYVTKILSARLKWCIWKIFLEMCTHQFTLATTLQMCVTSWVRENAYFSGLIKQIIITGSLSYSSVGLNDTLSLLQRFHHWYGLPECVCQINVDFVWSAFSVSRILIQFR